MIPLRTCVPRVCRPHTVPPPFLPNYGMVRVTQRSFVPSPPAGTDLLELRFRVLT